MDFAPAQLLLWFLVLKGVQHLAERLLARTNWAWCQNAERQAEACRVLAIGAEDFKKTLAYSADKYRFGQVTGWVSAGVTLAFLGFGGLGVVEAWAGRLAAMSDGGSIVTGLCFFGLLGLLSFLFSQPFDWYRTFRIEEKHGFNRQTMRGFIGDRIKGILIAVILGGLLLSLVLWIMQGTGHRWWIYAWLVVSGFSILTAWIYPTLLAPLFNKFSPLQPGELKDGIDRLASAIGFRTSGVFVMDASKRSSHGNAYFTGVFGKKRIVLFDTLVQSLSPAEVVAVLAHELGHFKLHHVRWQLLRGVAMTGVTFFLLSLMLPQERFYQAFGMSGVTNYGGLLVFLLWFGLLDFVMQPFENWLSRRNEFAADRFAVSHSKGSRELGSALLKLREKSHAMPLSHPLFASVYYSHPPLLTRLKAMGYGA